MDLQPNKTDGIYLPITNTRISASEWNQLVGSCMAFITEAGLTPDASDNEQFLNAFKTIAASLEIVGANTNLSNLTATGEARFTTKADTDLGNVSATGKATAIGWSLPDYSAGVSISSTGSYTPTTYGEIRITTNDTNSRVKISLNGVPLIWANTTSSYTDRSSDGILVEPTQTYTIEENTNCTMIFYPLKGAN